MLKYLVMLASLMILAGEAVGANLTSTVSSEGKTVISLDGSISDGDSGQFAAIVKASNAQNRLVSGIRLNSPGGNLVEGFKLADAIRFAKIATVVPNGKVCASACFLAFAGGNEKFVSFSAQVGIHSASDLGGKETVSSSSATVEMARFAKELGVPEPIIGKMIVTTASRIAWLSPNELRSMGATMTGKPAQSVETAQLPAPVDNTNLNPQSQNVVGASPRQTWEGMLNSAISVSELQNNGKARFVRSCQPELKLCNSAIMFKKQDNTDVMVRVSESINGVIIKRDVCSFNLFGDIRTCTNWDNQSVEKEMKDNNGVWNIVN